MSPSGDVRIVLAPLIRRPVLVRSLQRYHVLERRHPRRQEPMSNHLVSRKRRRATCLLALLASLVVATTTADAADEDTGTSETGELKVEQPPRRADPDFLFGRPRTFIGVSVGWLAPSEEGGIFDFTRDLLTVDDGDFDTAVVRFGVGRAMSPRLDIVAEIGFGSSSVVSEYRDFVDFDDLPIVQTTELAQTPLGGSLRFWLIPRGRDVSRLAWVPNRFAPYLGAGGGALWYRFTQFGEFVDFVDLSIFSDRLESSGWTTSGHLFAGASISLTRRLFLDVEARYVWANTPLSGDFVGFDNIDLDSVQLTGGIEFVF